MKNFCPMPFQNMEIYWDKVYLCCPDWISNKYSNYIGNFKTNTFEEIWNSPQAIKYREMVLKGDYSLCDKNQCPFILSNKFDKTFFPEGESACKPVMEKAPLIVKFGYDTECNIACNICRDNIIVHDEQKLKELDDMIDTFFIPMLKGVKLVCLNACGDSVGSRHSRKLIQRITETYPDIKFDLLTNGLFCNEKTLTVLRLKKRIYKLRISLHAAKKETYAKVVKNGERLFDNIVNNLYTLKILKSEHDFYFYIQMVVSSDNYRDMPEFVDFVKKFDAEPSMWEYKPLSKGFPDGTDVYAKEIVNPNHPEHKEFLEVLKDPRLNLPETRISPLLHQLRESQLSPYTKIKEKCCNFVSELNPNNKEKNILLFD